MDTAHLKEILRDASQAAYASADADPAEPCFKFCMMPAAGQCRQLIIATKWPLAHIDEQFDDSCKNISVLTKQGRLCDEQKLLISHLLTICRPTIKFIGDLDAFDLIHYLEVRQFCQTLETPVEYVGISTQWLTLVQQAMGSAFETICMKIQPAECALVEKLLRAFPDLRQLIPEGIQLLERGYKLELEGASLPFRNDHVTEQLLHLIVD